MIYVTGGGAFTYVHVRFCGDKYKLHHHKVMRKVLGLILTKWHVPSPVLVQLLVLLFVTCGSVIIFIISE